MKIENLKELQKIIQLCRKLGVTDMKVDGLEFHLGDPPHSSKKQSSSVDLTAFPEAAIPVPAYNGQPEDIAPPKIDMPDELSQEQLLFYSAQGHTEQQQAN